MTLLASTLQPWYTHDAPTPRAPEHTGSCVHQAVAAAVCSQPHCALLVDETRHLSNADLLQAVDRRARMLASRSAGGDTVAVCLDAGIELVVTYLGCLRAGLRYLPLPAGPASVTRRLLETIAPALLVTCTGRDPGITGLDTLRVDEAESAPANLHLPRPDPRRPAHVLLTSGTETGVPKAVVTDHVGSMLSHGWRPRLWPFDPSRDVVGCNIFGIWDVVPALLHGVPVVMLTDATLRDPLALAGAVVRYGITRLMITPTLLGACLESADAVAALRRLRLVVLCGETATQPLMRRAWERAPGVQFANLYSLSECHDVAAGNLVPGEPVDTGRVAPFAEVHVVQPDDPQALMPVGQAGRVLVGGGALARGYLDDRHTRERFYDVAFGVDAVSRRVYDTGDLGRLEADGSLQILGRVSAGVKLRGAWANQDAVAALLMQDPLVLRAATVTQTDADGRAGLRAFVVPAEAAPADLGRTLRTRVAARLPPQSVPSRIDLLDELPLLPSGKVDSTKLRELGSGSEVTPSPQSDRGRSESLDHEVLAAFRVVLGHPDAAATDTFDDLGGDSLAAVALCGKIQAATGRPVRVRDLQRHPTAAGLARHLTTRKPQALPDRVPLPIDRLPAAARRPDRQPQTILLTGATGMLGSVLLRRLITAGRHVVALVRADDGRHARTRLQSALPDHTDLTHVTPIAGDLTLPGLGLSQQTFAGLVRQVDVVLHLGARLDMFAGYESLAAVNVAGTRAVLELALAAGAAFHHLSSSAVLPMDAEENWDETHHGRATLERLAPRLMSSDGYSQTKLCAEALVWQAAERGLRVTVTRVPHLVTGSDRSRLTDTLSTLLALDFLPEGPWQWQLADVHTVCDHLVHLLQPRHRDLRLTHVAPRPVTDREIAAALAARGLLPHRLSLPALANVVADAARADGGRRSNGRVAANVVVLDQLAREHGIRAALCLGEAVLVSREPPEIDAARLLVDFLPD